MVSLTGFEPVIMDRESTVFGLLTTRTCAVFPAASTTFGTRPAHRSPLWVSVSARVYKLQLRSGTCGGIRTHTVLILNQSSATSWTTQADSTGPVRLMATVIAKGSLISQEASTTHLLIREMRNPLVESTGVAPVSEKSVSQKPATRLGVFRPVAGSLCPRHGGGCHLDVRLPSTPAVTQSSQYSSRATARLSLTLDGRGSAFDLTLLAPLRQPCGWSERTQHCRWRFGFDCFLDEVAIIPDVLF